MTFIFNTLVSIMVGYFLGALLVAPTGIGRRIGFWKTFLWCLVVTPFIGLFIAMNSGRLNARGCKHCGNEYNEAEYCGICGKNEEGKLKS